MKRSPIDPYWNREQWRRFDRMVDKAVLMLGLLAAMGLAIAVLMGRL